MFPQLVSKGANDKLSLRYTGIIPPVEKAIQEQQTEITNNKKEMNYPAAN
jgi:hypothetical protein